MNIKSYFSEMPTPVKFTFLLMLMMVSSIITVLVGVILVGLPIYGTNITNLITRMNDINDPLVVSFDKFMQILSQFGLFLVPGILYIYLFDNSIKNSFKFKDKSKVLYVLFSILLIIFCFPIINNLSELNLHLKLPEVFKNFENWMKQSEDNAAVITDAFLKTTDTKNLIINIFMIAIIPAIAEELIFRGIFLKIFVDWTKNIAVGIIISSVVFSSFHMQFYGFLPRFVLGLLLCYLFIWTKSIWYPIIAHFFNNLAGVLLSYFSNLKLINTQRIENIGTQKSDIFILIISFLLVFGLLYLLFKKSKKIVN